MKFKTLKIKKDPGLSREVGEAPVKGDVYRTVAFLNNRYRLDGILSMGGFGVIYTGCDTRLFNKKILVKANRYPRNLFKVQRNKAVLTQADKLRGRLAFERKMLLQAANRGIGGTPVLLDVIEDLGLDLRGPHTDQDGQTHYWTQKDEEGRELWTREPFLVLSFVSGRPLGDMVKDAQFRNNLLGNAKQVILQIGRILAGFHREESVDGAKIGFVYQDLKPDNIMLTREKNFVLIDFGGFAVRADGKTLIRFAKTGTPGYQPPEFCDYGFPPEDVDSRADVFSLGATVHHLLSGEAPKTDAGGRAVFDRSKLTPFPVEWPQWIDRATAAKPKDRFLNMQEALNNAHKLPMHMKT